MGLDTTHDCWHGSYLAFGCWRNAVAEVAGYEVRRTRFPDGWEVDVPVVVLDETWIEANFQGDWEQSPEDPLLVLLVHSDCDGKIAAKHAGLLAGRLEQVLPKIATRPDDAGHIGNWEVTTRAFIAGLRAASAAGEDVEFL